MEISLTKTQLRLLCDLVYVGNWVINAPRGDARITPYDEVESKVFFAAAKEGIRGMSRVAATEWGADGINVNVVCPLAWTAQLENFEKAYPEAFKANVKMPPAGHFGDPELEIGRVCVQLASPDFKYLNGETLTLEGGMGLRP
mgnify:CR=1 FL=1